LLQQTFKVKQIEIALRLIQGQANKIKKKKALVYLLKESHWLISFGLKKIIFNKSKALVIDYQVL